MSRMKIFFLIMILLAVAVPVFSLDNFSNNHPFQVIGFINKDLLLSVDIDQPLAVEPYDRDDGQAHERKGHKGVDVGGRA